MKIKDAHRVHKYPAVSGAPPLDQWLTALYVGLATILSMGTERAKPVHLIAQIVRQVALANVIRATLAFITTIRQ